MRKRWPIEHTLNKDEIKQYLHRLSYLNVHADIKTLQGLHLAHMRHIPFENLDIVLGDPIKLSLKPLLEKIVSHKRGGFCYELNFTFGALLASLGFDIQLLSAQVYSEKVFGEKGYGPAFDHMLLLVTIAGQCFIADVGFGDSFRQPLFIGNQLDGSLNNSPVNQCGFDYKIVNNDESLVLMRKKSNLQSQQSQSVWQPQYQFSLKGYGIADFNEMCVYQQTSFESGFTQRAVCSVATPTGRLTLANNRFIQTNGIARDETLITDMEHYRVLLKKYFQITLTANVFSTLWKNLKTIAAPDR